MSTLMSAYMTTTFSHSHCPQIHHHSENQNTQEESSSKIKNYPSPLMDQCGLGNIRPKIFLISVVRKALNT